MKTHPTFYRRDGNVLVICLFTCAVIGIAIASCFAYVRNQMGAAARSQSWNESLVLSEAGIEDGMGLINKYSSTTTARGHWTNTAASDSWSTIGTAPLVFRVRRSISGSQYDVYVTNNADGQPTIRSVASKQFSGGEVTIQRAIVVKAAPGSLFQGGLIAKGGVSLKGNVLVDSFNSQVAGANINGQYDPSIRRDNGSIASASSNVVANVSASGSVEVYGKIYTGPEDSFINNGGATVGSEAFVDGSTAGVESGFVQNDLNLYIPDAPTPQTGGLPLPMKTSNFVQGSNYLNSYKLSTGNYQENSIQLVNSEKIVVEGNVKLYVPVSFRMSGQSQVIILPGSSLTLYAGGTVDLSGGGVLNGTGYATNLTVNGLTTCTSIKYTGGSDFIGTIYAPYASFDAGGGSGDFSLVGSVVAGSIKIDGNYEVHYDESLLQLPSGPHYYAISWKEIPVGVVTVTTGTSAQAF